MYDFLLFVHVLFAVGLVAAMTTFWALIVSTRSGRMSLTPAGAMVLGRAGAILVGISSLGVLVFGVWLAVYLDAYDVFDGWVIGSVILWAISTGAGQRGGRYYQRAAEAGTDGGAALRRSGLQLQLVATASVLLILVLMIFKPGA